MAPKFDCGGVKSSCLSVQSSLNRPVSVEQMRYCERDLNPRCWDYRSQKLAIRRSGRVHRLGFASGRRTRVAGDLPFASMPLAAAVELRPPFPGPAIRVPGKVTRERFDIRR